MNIPNADKAVIAADKIRDYLLNPDHRRGASKARLLLAFGYRAQDWQILEADLRHQHLPAEVHTVKDTPWGRRYMIRAPLRTPGGREILIESIWQIDAGTDVPRFITMYPR